MGMVKTVLAGSEGRPLISVKMGFEFDAKDKYSEPTTYYTNRCNTQLPDDFDITGKKFRLFVGSLKPGTSPFESDGWRGYGIRDLMSASTEDTEITGESLIVYKHSGATLGYVRFEGSFTVRTTLNNSRNICVEVACPSREWASNNSIRYMNVMVRLDIYE